MLPLDGRHRGAGDSEERLCSLRAELVAEGFDGLIVPLTDEHGSEYVAPYAKRLEWLTGFTGSCGTAVVLVSEAAIFVDGRYSLQVERQIDAASWSSHHLNEVAITEWILSHASSGCRIGYDPWLHSPAQITAIERALRGSGITLIPVARNPIDIVWDDQPRAPCSPAFLHSEHLSGEPASEKRNRVGQILADADADALIITALASVAWLHNLRGSDIPFTPVCRAFSILKADRSSILFAAPGTIPSEIVQQSDGALSVRDIEEFVSALEGLTGKRILLDHDRSAIAIKQRLCAVKADVLPIPDPIQLLKARKNSAEIDGQRVAQRLDGIALSRFLHWCAVSLETGQVTEQGAARQLEAFRRQAPELKSLAFETIAAAGANAASPHYVPHATGRDLIKPDTLFLFDSGGQYECGTTDVTRVVAVGSPSSEMIDRFTRVLKGHIAIATAVFPLGTTGVQIDAFARRPLWNAGLDYAHGTGHGVGAFLSVHEGPQRLAPPAYSGAMEPLLPGMILSNEPGYYLPDRYGIRIESLLLVVHRDLPGAERQMLAFETLTLAPVDRRLIEVALLTQEEREWIDSYHERVFTLLHSRLEAPVVDWLRLQCAPL